MYATKPITSLKCAIGLRINWVQYDGSKIERVQVITMATYHYTDVIMGAMAYQITSLTIVYSTVYSGADRRKHQGCAPLAFVRGIHR